MIPRVRVTYSLPVNDGWEARCSLPDDDGYAASSPISARGAGEDPAESASRGATVSLVSISPEAMRPSSALLPNLFHLLLRHLGRVMDPSTSRSIPVMREIFLPWP